MLAQMQLIKMVQMVVQVLLGIRSSPSEAEEGVEAEDKQQMGAILYTVQVALVVLLVEETVDTIMVLLTRTLLLEQQILVVEVVVRTFMAHTTKVLAVQA